jgi:hypothetical protein
MGLGTYMEKNFHNKTDEDVLEALTFINAPTLPDEEIPDAIKYLDGVARELRYGLAQTFSKSSRDVRENISENFYEFDRDLRFGQFHSHLAGLRLDFAVDPIPDKHNPETLRQQRHAHVQAVEEKLRNDGHARGLLFAMIGADCTELALAGLPRERADMLRPFIHLLTKRTQSLVVGLNELHAFRLQENHGARDVSKRNQSSERTLSVPGQRRRDASANGGNPLC